MLRSSPSRWEPSPPSRRESISAAGGADVASGALWLAVSVLTAALFLSTAQASAIGPIFATISGPTAAAVSTVTIYNLSISGGPSGPVNYTVTWHITGSDITGGLPLLSNPTSASGTSPTFKLNITTPSKEQT